MGRGACQATVHGVTKSQTQMQLSDLHIHTHIYIHSHIIILQLYICIYTYIYMYIYIYTHIIAYHRASQVVLVVKNPPVNAGDVRDMHLIPRSGRALEKGMVTHASTLAWRIPWSEGPGGL